MDPLNTGIIGHTQTVRDVEVIADWVYGNRCVLKVKYFVKYSVKIYGNRCVLKVKYFVKIYGNRYALKVKYFVKYFVKIYGNRCALKVKYFVKYKEPVPKLCVWRFLR